jgi:hypothetical protein
MWSGIVFSEIQTEDKSRQTSDSSDDRFSPVNYTFVGGTGAPRLKSTAADLARRSRARNEAARTRRFPRLIGSRLRRSLGS